MFLFLLGIYIPWCETSGSTGNSLFSEKFSDTLSKQLCPISGLLAMCEARCCISVGVVAIVCIVQELLRPVSLTLICNPLMAKDANCLLKDLVVSCVASWENFTFSSFPMFVIRLLIFFQKLSEYLQI